MTKITNNQRETLAVIDDVTGNPMYLKGLNGALDVNAIISSATISGSKSNNAGVPGATNLGVLPAIATAAAPTYTEGNQVSLSTDLAGNVRVTGSISVGGTTDNSAFTAGSSTGTAAMGFYHSTIDAVTDGRAATVAITAKRAMMVNLQTSAGAETGIAALPLQISLANTGANTNKLLVTADPITFASAQSVNATLSAETTKVIGTINVAAAQTIAVTNAGTFATQSTLAAETTKAIGVTRTADGSGNLLTSTTNALDVNLKTSSITVATQEASPSTIFNGKTAVTTAGSRVVLAASTTVKYVTIKALSTNTGFIYVGNASVASSNGLQLKAGETVSLAIANLTTVNLDSSVNGEGVTYMAVN